MKKPRIRFVCALQNISSPTLPSCACSARSCWMSYPASRAGRGVHFLRSSAGGGKTSLMRLFTPPALLALHAQRTTEDYKELHQRMQELGVIDDDGPRMLGIKLTCGHTYATLADLDCDEVQKTRFLFALLDARIILAALRGALTLRRLVYPDDLFRLRIVPPHDVDLPSSLRLPSAGPDIYAWATHLEASVCDALIASAPSKTPR